MPTDIATNPNYDTALKIIEAVRLRFPLGAINQSQIAKKLKITDSELSSHLHRIDIIVTQLETKRETPPDFDMINTVMMDLYTAHCVLMTHYGIAFSLIALKSKVPVEPVAFPHHLAIVIGRDPSSDPDDVKTWGKDAIICDPWANQIYAVSDLDDVRQQSPNIVFNKLIMNAAACRPAELVQSVGHYLAGTPKACVLSPQARAESYKMKLQRWIEQDIIEQQKPINDTTSGDKEISAESAELIRAFLNYATRQPGWKFYPKEKIALLQVNSEPEAKELTAVFNAMKFARFSLVKHATKNKLYIKCISIDVGKLCRIRNTFKPMEITHPEIISTLKPSQAELMTKLIELLRSRDGVQYDSPTPFTSRSGAG